MALQFFNKRSGYPLLSSMSLSQLSRLLLKLLLLSAALTAFSKAQSPTLLIKAFKQRTIDLSEFVPTINAGYNCCSVRHYKTQGEFYFAIMNGVCCCCKLFDWLSLLAIILRSNPVVIAVLKNHVINLACVNYCGQNIDQYYFCLLYYHLIK